MKKILSVLGVLGICLYPAAVYFGIKHFQPRLLALMLGSLLLVKLATGSTFSLTGAAPRHGENENPGLTPQSGRRQRAQTILAGTFIAGIIFYTLTSNTAAGLKLYPAIVSLFLLASFSYSLLHPPTVIEKIARISDAGLTEAGVRYTRKVTILWCVFFLLNAAAALYTSFFAPMEAWALYNGLISYLLIGSLLAGEYCYRTFVRKQD